MKIGIYINKRKEKLPLVLDVIFKLFSMDKDEIVFLNEINFIQEQYGINLNRSNNLMEVDYDILVAIGGDGTIISAIRSQFHLNRPIIGVHVGHLGFLAESDLDNCSDVLKQIKSNNYRTQLRSVFNVSIDAENFIAVNDVVIDRGKSGRIIRVNVHDRKSHVNSYEGDGLIISTANGSTAYSLSAGGPIISPNLNLFTLTPICSHSLMTRTIVLSEQSQLFITFPPGEDRGKLTIDGQTTLNLKDEIKINISISNQKVPFVLIDKSNYYKKLRTKMGWNNSRNE